MFPLVLSIPVGLIVTNILVVNNLRDLPTDLAAGKRTLATRIGERATRAQYVVFIALAFMIPTLVGVTNPARRALLIVLISAPFGLKLARKVMSGASGRDLNRVLAQTGRLLLFFGLLLSAGALLGRST